MIIYGDADNMFRVLPSPPHPPVHKANNHDVQEKRHQLITISFYYIVINNLVFHIIIKKMASSFGFRKFVCRSISLCKLAVDCVASLLLKFRITSCFFNDAKNM